MTMTKQEFLEQLRKALGSRVSSSAVNENISYYEEYIATQVRAGKSEEEVIRELGDPRLLARSIADASRREGTERTREKEEFGEENISAHRAYRLPGWLILVGVLCIVLLIFSAVFSVLRILIRALFPILLPLAIIVFFLKFLQRK